MKQWNLLLAATLATAMAAMPAMARTYTLTELTIDARTPFTNVSPSGMNEAGVVIGDGYSATRPLTALMWDAAGVGRVIAPPGSLTSRANAINASGKVVGTAEFDEIAAASGTAAPLAGAGRISRAFVYDPATDSFSYPAGDGSIGNDINNSGQIVGAIDGRPFFYDPATGLRTYALPAGVTKASFDGITNDGTIIGIRAAVSPLGPQNSSTSFILANADGVIPDGPMNPTFSTTFLASNNAGQFSIQQSIVNAPFFSSGSGIYNLDGTIAANQLGLLPFYVTTYGGGFNDFLDIVGESYNENLNGGSVGIGAITTRDGITSALAPMVVNLGGYFIQQGRVINNAGVIAAFGGGKAFTLRPNDVVTPGVPEPASWAMMIAGFGLAGAAMRRRRALAAAGIA